MIEMDMRKWRSFLPFHFKRSNTYIKGVGLWNILPIYSQKYGIFTAIGGKS